MRLPRLTVRLLLIVVALLALTLGLAGWMQRRAVTFRLEAARQYQGWVDHARPDPRDDPGPEASYHLAMYEKYLKAASRPWLPVAPDPPAPKE